MELLDFLSHRGIENFALNKCEHQREELQSQPVFSSLLGPMYNGKDKDGNIIIRYESSEVYRELSC